MAKVLALVALLSGCSIALQAKPNKTATRDCHTTHAYWVADAALTVGAAAAVVYAVRDQSDTAMTIGGVSALAGVVTAGSSVSGYRWRSRCASQPEQIEATGPQTAAI